MMSEWKTKKLKDLATFSQGIQIDLDEHKKIYEKKYVPFLRIENYTQKSNDLRYVPEKYANGKMVSKNDIVVVRYGASSGFIGRGQDGILANNLFKVEPNKLITKDYLYLILKSSKTKRFIQRAMFGGAMPAISFGLIGAVEIKYPNSIALQDDIVAKFDILDTVIEKTEALIDAKERQFGWLVTRLINKSGHNKKLLSDFISEVSIRNRNNEIDRVLSVTNRNGFVLPEDHFERRVASANVTNYKVVHKGEYAYNPSRINVGSIARLDKWDDGILSPMYTVFQLDEKTINSDYFLHWLSSSEAKQRIKKSAQGSVRETVGFDDLGAIPIHLPDLQAQLKIAETLNMARDEIDLLKNLADHYRTQKRGLMQKLLSGEWHIKNKEAA
jgi:type I restriction enzyme S subunit